MTDGIPCPLNSLPTPEAYIIDEPAVRGTITECGHVPVMGEYSHCPCMKSLVNMMLQEVKNCMQLRQKLRDIHRERRRIERAKQKKNLKIEQAKAKERLRAEQGYQTWKQKLGIWFINTTVKHGTRNERLNLLDSEGKAFPDG
jgi:hypothetical protein